LKKHQVIQNRGKWNWDKIVRYGIKTLGWITVVAVVIWVTLWAYLVTHEEALRDRVAAAIHKKTRGDVTIGGMSVSFFRTFPLLSLRLNNVVIKDSVTTFAHKDFLRASNIYLRISIPGLIKGRSPIGKILVRNGELNVASDSAGNTNEYIFRTKPRDAREAATSFPDLELQNVSGSYVDPTRRKDYSAIIHSLKCSAKELNGILRIKMKLRALAKNITFNTLRGAYMQEKMIEGAFQVNYERESKDLIANNVKLYLDNHPFYLNAKFNLNKNDGKFYMNISDKRVMFAQAASFLSMPIRQALKPYSLNHPAELFVKLSGKTLFGYIPLVEVFLDVKNNKAITPQGMFEDCSFNGYFTNEMVKGKERDDQNSYLRFTKFMGRWENIKLVSDTIKIANLAKPYLECDAASDVDLKTVNKLTESKTLQFLDGKTSFKIRFKGPVYGGDSLAANVNGRVDINEASIKYIPRSMLLSHCNGNLNFVNNDLFVNKLNAEVGKTKLMMGGSAKNFLSLLKVSPEKLILKWKISSPELHLEDFKTLLSSSKSGSNQQRKGTIARTSSKIDKMFSDGDMYINLDALVMDYKTFRASDVKAEVVFRKNDVKLEKVFLNHAEGSMSVKGQMTNGADKNAVVLNVNMQKMDIPTLFTAFNNFGQDAVTNKNLKGKLSAIVHYNTSITNKAELVSADADGTIEFLLEDGELNNFEPLQEIGDKAFRKQDFSKIRFADLSNRLDLKGTAFIINSMDIRSTALNFTVEGVYDYKKGTDMFIKLPFRNMMKSQANTDITENGKPARGPSVRLRAKTGDDGKLKINWDPLRLSRRNKKGVMEASTEKK
jgi:hypothetical protein